MLKILHDSSNTNQKPWCDRRQNIAFFSTFKPHTTRHSYILETTHVWNQYSQQLTLNIANFFCEKQIVEMVNKMWQLLIYYSDADVYDISDFSLRVPLRYEVLTFSIDYFKYYFKMILTSLAIIGESVGNNFTDKIRLSAIQV